MKKIGLYAAVFLWIIVAGKYLGENYSIRPVSLAEAFEETPFVEMETNIEGYGEFGVCYLSTAEKEELVKNIAGAIGVNWNGTLNTVRKDDIAVTELLKESVNGTVSIKAITEEEKNEDGNITATQYIYIKLSIYNHVDCATDYRELISGLFEEMGIEGNVNINLSGTLEGILNDEQKNQVADELLAKLDAETVAENRSGELFTIYAFSEGISPYIHIGSSKINVNIAINYDEIQNQTVVYLSSPVSTLDY